MLDFVKKIKVHERQYSIFNINKLEEQGLATINGLPFSIKILVENLLRRLDGKVVQEADLLQTARWQKTYDQPVEIPLHPARVLMQDFTGVPAVVDLAAMRDAVRALGQDPARINPLIPVDLVIDHSLQVDYFGVKDAEECNLAKEYQRNRERYLLLKWAQQNFDNLRVVPPNSGICHQVNLEYLAQVVVKTEINGQWHAFPDSLVGTDSHTTMINGLGVMGWGVGGIEAEAVMLGQPYYMSLPEVVGVRMINKPREGINATDLALWITTMLRKHGVVEKFVEFFGPGMQHLALTDRATIANMAPEYGATMGFFPVDDKTIDYLKLTNRTESAELVEIYCKEQGLFNQTSELQYTEVLEIDLSEIESSLAGPSRPQDRINLSDLKESVTKSFNVNMNVADTEISHGSIVIAALTSCTNTSNPLVMLSAGLLAQKAVEKGLRVPAHVKTSLAPGSRVVPDYLRQAGLLSYLETLGFQVVGFGCAVCIGNSGPLHPEIEKAIIDNDLTVCSVLSGNRNFEARIHQSIKGNYLASPPLVVALALAGRINIDLTTEPLGFDPQGKPVFLADIWPCDHEIRILNEKCIKKDFFYQQYRQIFEGDQLWQELSVSPKTTFAWDPESTYIKLPPYFEDFQIKLKKSSELKNARALVLLGDSVTTDHISPAGAIPENYPAGQYLINKEVAPSDFNSYGSRRGNHEVMMRGTFGNIRIKNRLCTKEGGFTRIFPEGREMFIFDAAEHYQTQQTSLLVLAGREYGTGSSRDWAAKGTNLLGVRAVLACSYERIHRSNLVGMGVLPLLFKEKQSWENLGLDGSETYSIDGIEQISPRKLLPVTALCSNGNKISFEVRVGLNTNIEVEYIKNSGILPYVLRKMFKEK